MKRIIKFRAWHRTNRLMYWWELIWGNHSQGNGYIGMVPWGEERSTKGNYRGNMTLIDPDNCELMQFTGLTDKNGKEIYEMMILNNSDIVCIYEYFYYLCDISNGDIKILNNENKTEVTGEYYELSQDTQRCIDEYVQQAERKIKEEGVRPSFL